MPRPRLVSISIRTPSVRFPGAVLLLVLRVGRAVTGTPIGGLRRAPVRAMPCPCALLAQTVRLTMSSHGAFIRYLLRQIPGFGKFKNPPMEVALFSPRHYA